MRKHLGWIAAAGLAACVLLLGGAWLIAGKAGLGDIALRLSAARLPICRGDGSDRPVSREIAWDGADSIGIAIPATVRYSPGSGDQVKVIGDAALVSHLRIAGGEIKLDCQPARLNAEHLDITLPGRSFRTFSLASVTSLILNDIDQPELNLNIAGSSMVAATGKVDSITLNGAGMSDAKLGALAAKTVKLNLAGASQVEVAPEDDLDINAFGAVTVTLLSEPKTIRTNIVGSGRVIHKGL